MPEHSRHSCVMAANSRVSGPLPYLSGCLSASVSLCHHVCLCLSLDPRFSLSLSPSVSWTLVWFLGGSDSARLAALGLELVLQGAVMWPCGADEPHL